ncbi:MAG: aldehyde dehydrogenase (NADP(+)) [Acidobacteriota bacterium]
MTLNGKNLIGYQWMGEGSRLIHAVNPSNGRRLEPSFVEATEAEADRALALARSASEDPLLLDANLRSAFLKQIALEIEALGDALIERAGEETGLPAGRLQGERGRTVNQIRMFANLIDEGSMVGARIDHGDPGRKPVPKPDIRRMLIPIGPVAVFGASNFPLAFSVAGGDTASALAAGNPVVCKAHPAHPGTSELVAGAIMEAARKLGLPEGIFSMLHGASHEIGLLLARHPNVKAVAFTGSQAGGRALFDAGAARTDPIPVYAEMGSINPVFLLPGILETDSERIARGLVQSVTLGVGQFCTNPGLVIAMRGASLDRFLAELRSVVDATNPGTMLHSGIRDAFERGVETFCSRPGIDIVGRSSGKPVKERTEAAPIALVTDAETFLRDRSLSREVFGPSSLIVACEGIPDMLEVAASLEGNLTATIHATPQEVLDHSDLVRIVRGKVGRLIFNGFPTGVEVCPAMQHGGPYPATTDSKQTSVGTAAVFRFLRPVSYQDWPEAALPVELRDENERDIWRLVDGEWTKS